jgi:hypothetical protein
MQRFRLMSVYVLFVVVVIGLTIAAIGVSRTARKIPRSAKAGRDVSIRLPLRPRAA